jgi:fructokinase
VIVVGGEALIDLIVTPDGGLTANPGGGPFNTARTIGRLGLPVAFIGGLSTDAFGRRLRDALARDGVSLELAIETDRPTTLAVAQLDDVGAASYRFYTERTSATALDSGRLPALAGRPISAVHVGTLGLVLDPLADAMEALVGSAPHDAVVMVDVNARSSATPDQATYVARIERLLDRVDVVKASTDDLAFLRPELTPMRAVNDVLSRGASVVLWTDGSKPVLVYTATGHEEIQPPVVKVVDTVGAGDALGGGFLASWIEVGRRRSDLVTAARDRRADPGLGVGAEIMEAARRAVHVASITCTRSGADPPTAAELADWLDRC